MKGIVLAGGAGSRLYPLTTVMSKQLLPVYDKPMIYYPIGTLMLAGIRDILVISTPEDLPRFRSLLQDGHHWGIQFSYEVQPRPEGLAQAFTIGKSFVGTDPVALILGDNIFYGPQFRERVQAAAQRTEGATVFGYFVREPQHYGVAEVDKEGRIISLEEKPERPKSHCAVTGLYFYDNEVLDIARLLKPSQRGEYEITDVNREYLRRQRLRLEFLGRGFAWLDAGTPQSLAEAGSFIATIEERQGLKVCVPEEIAYRMGYIDQEQLLRLASKMGSSLYGKYLRRLPTDLAL